MFEYKSCGLSDVRLRNGYEEIDTPYGKAVSIQDVEGLHRAIGTHIVDHNPRLLRAEEIAFLRKELDLPQVQLAHLLDVNESTVRNWESGRSTIQGPADRMLRALYLEKIRGGGRIRRMLEHVSALNREVYEAPVLELEESGKGWKTSTAA